MKQEVFVVYRGHGPWEGVSIYAIYGHASGLLIGNSASLKNLDLPTLYLTSLFFAMSAAFWLPFKIKKVSVDMIYPFSIMQDEKEAI